MVVMTMIRAFPVYLKHVTKGKTMPKYFLQNSHVVHRISKSRSTFLKTEKTTFLDLRVFDVFCVFLIVFCVFFAGKVGCFF